MHCLLLAALLLTLSPAVAQPDDTLALAHVGALLDAPAADVTGTYTAGAARLRIVPAAEGYTLYPAGQTALAVVTDDPADPAANVRAEALLGSALDGDLAGLLAAVAPHRRAAATRDYGRFLRLMSDAHGPAETVTVLGTLARADGRADTFVRVRFARGTETMKLVWRDGHLALLTRAPAPSFAAQPVPGHPGRYAVIGSEGAPCALLTLDGSRLTLRSPHGTWTAHRSR